MTRFPLQRCAVILCLLLLGLSLGGCSPCGWIWDEGKPGACRSDTPKK